MPNEKKELEQKPSATRQARNDSPGRESQEVITVQKHLVEKARAIIIALVAAGKSQKLYPDEHAVAIDSARDLFDLIDEILAVRSECSFNIFDQELFFDDLFLAEGSRIHSQLIIDCTERKVGSITFVQGLELDEITIFLRLFNKSPEELSAKGGFTQSIAQEGISHIRLGQLRKMSEKEKEAKERENQGNALENYQLVLETFRQVAQTVKENELVEDRQIRHAIKPLVDLVLKEKSVLLRLSAIKNYDQYTFYHSVNTLVLSLALGAALGLEKTPLMILAMAALLHDVGKVKMPLDILKKPTSLTSEEWTAVRRHPVDGAEILGRSPDLHKLVMVVAFEHHMGHDHSGYPMTSAKRPQHTFSRVVQVADVYDAMTSDRCYQRAELPDQALSVMFCLSGRILDPLVFKVFVNTMGIYPVGSVARLDSQEIAIVYQSNSKDLLRPKVKLIMDAAGKHVEPSIVDLTEKEDGSEDYRRTLVHTLKPTQLNIDITKYL